MAKIFADAFIMLCTWHLSRRLASAMKADLGAEAADQILGWYWKAVYASATPSGMTTVAKACEKMLTVAGASKVYIASVLEEVKGELF